MTMTEAPPTTEVAEDAVEVAGPPNRVVGFYDWISSSDHTTIGRLWVYTSVLIIVATAAVGAIVGIEGLDAADVDLFGGTNEYFRYWSLHRIGIAFLGVAPLFVGLAILVVPLQVGATNLAFPRAALAAFWTWLAGGIILVTATLAGGGWGALDGVTSEESDAIALTLVGTGMVIVSLLVALMCVVTTLIAFRTEGMNLLRVPLFSWSMLVTAGVWFLTLPILLVNLAVVYLDLQGPGPFVFGDPEPSERLIISQLSWALEQPQVFALAIPVLGILGSVVPVSAGVRSSRHWLMATLIGVYGLFSIGGWYQPAFNDIDQDLLFVVFGIGVGIPVLALLGGAMATLVGGRESLALPGTALIGVMGAVLVLVAAGVSAGARAIDPFELAGTAAVGGIFTLVIAASVLAGIAGLWFWAPKLSGTTFSEGLGRLAVTLVLFGGVAAGGAQVVAGFFDAPDLALQDVDEDIVDVLNVVTLLGWAVAALGAVAMLAGIARALSPNAPAAAADPWAGQTLEWLTASPPERGNFDEPLEPVASATPLLDARASEPSAHDEGEDA